MTDSSLPVQTATLSARGDARIEPDAWVERGRALAELLVEDGLSAADLGEALRAFRFLDDRSVQWSFDGARWVQWDGAQWSPGEPEGLLRFQPIEMEVPFGSLEDFDPDGALAPQDYDPTHVVPEGGAWAWASPDPAAAPDEQIDAGVDVMVVDWRADGWAQIVCANEWSAWLDGRLLTPLTSL